MLQQPSRRQVKPRVHYKVLPTSLLAGGLTSSQHVVHCCMQSQAAYLSTSPATSRFRSRLSAHQALSARITEQQLHMLHTGTLGAAQQQGKADIGVPHRLHTNEVELPAATWRLGRLNQQHQPQLSSADGVWLDAVPTCLCSPPYL